MKRLILILIFALTMTIQAQDDNPIGHFRLRIPSTEAFIAAIPSIWSATQYLGDSSTNEGYEVISFLEHLFTERYEADATTETLVSAYNALNHGESYGYLSYQPYLQQVVWNQKILSRWLQENPTDLSTVHEIAFADYHIKVSRHNFDGEGDDEIVLDLQSGAFSDHWLAIPDPNTPGGYQLQTTPLPHRDSGNYWVVLEGTGARTVAIEDINADGKMEWLARSFTTFPGSGTIGATKYLFVLGWKDDELAMLTHRSVQNEKTGETALNFYLPESASDLEPIWQLGNLDADEALELVQIDHHLDNWGCERYVHSVLDWDGKYYTLTEAHETRAFSMNCALREAENLMRAQAYDEAIPLYQQAIARYNGDFVVYQGQEEDSEAQFTAYAQERLVIALVLAGRSDEAYAYLQTLADHPLLEGTLAEALLDLPRADFNPLEVCNTAYTAMQELRQLAGQYSTRGYRDLRALGNTIDDIYIYTETSFTGFPIVENGACNPAQVVLHIASAIRPSENASPIEQLEAQGIPTAADFSRDLNSDGETDWIVWLDAPYDTLYFISDMADDRSYDVFAQRYPALPRPSDSTKLTAVELPDQSGVALAVISTEQPQYPMNWCPIEQAADVHAPVASLTLWRVEDGAFKQTFAADYCEMPEFETAISGNVLYAWGNPHQVYDIENALEPVTYQWDAESSNYRAIDETPIELSSDDVSPQNPTIRIWDVEQAYRQSDYEQALELSDDLINILSPTAFDVLQVRHYRALSYLALNSPDEALAEYVTVYEATPESAWGLLAALHIEEIE